MKLYRSFATVGGLTLLSRVFGFLRDILIAAILGSGAVADAFFVAFRFPNLFRRLFGEGAFNAAFVPLFAKRLEGEGRESARAFAEEAMAGLVFILLAITVVAEITMPFLMYGLAPGFSETPEKFDLAVLLTRITMPYLLCMSLVALMSGVLNSFGKFVESSSVSIVLNGVMMLATFVGMALGYQNEPMAGVVQAVAQHALAARPLEHREAEEVVAGAAGEDAPERAPAGEDAGPARRLRALHQRRVAAAREVDVRAAALVVVVEAGDVGTDAVHRRQLERRRRGRQADGHRMQPEAAHGDVDRRQASQQPHAARLQPDFFARFPHRRVLDRFAGIDDAARKRDLAGVATEPRVPFGQDHVRPIAHREQEHQPRGVPQRRPARRRDRAAGPRLQARQ
jgi:hypothetical protein